MPRTGIGGENTNVGDTNKPIGTGTAGADSAGRMLIEEALVHSTRGIASVAERCDDRVEIGALSQGTAYPAIAIAVISKPRTYTSTQQDGLVEGLFQFTTWATSSLAAARDIGEDLRLAMSAFSGTIEDQGRTVEIEAMFLEDERDLFDAEHSAYGWAQDWRILFREP